MKNTIILHKDGEYETWTKLTELCKEHPEFSKSYLTKEKKLNKNTHTKDFTYKGVDFIKVPHNTGKI